MPLYRPPPPSVVTMGMAGRGGPSRSDSRRGHPLIGSLATATRTQHRMVGIGHRERHDLTIGSVNVIPDVKVIFVAFIVFLFA